MQKLTYMREKYNYFVSLLLLSKKVRIVVGLTVVLFLSGFMQTLAVTFQQDYVIESLDNVSSMDLLASVTVFSGSSVNLANIPKGKSVADDQQRTITGRIINEAGEGLPGVNIVEKGTVNGKISETDGSYSITVASASSVLVFSFVGYTPQEITVGSQTSINVTLAESAVGLDEIVVVGYRKEF